MSVALLGPVQRTADAAPGVLINAAAYLVAFGIIWKAVVASRKTRPAVWVRRNILHRFWKAMVLDWRTEKIDRDRAEANARILKVVEAALVPLATKVDEIAHSTNGKPDGAATMSDEVSTLIAKVDLIGGDLALHQVRIEGVIGEQLLPRLAAVETAAKAVTELVSALVGRVAVLEGKPHDPHPPASAAHPSQHRRHDDT